MAALLFVKVFRAGFLRKKPLPKLSSEAQTVPKEQDIIQQKTLFREFLQTQVPKEPPVKQKRTSSKPKSISRKGHRKSTKILEPEGIVPEGLPEKPTGTPDEASVKECPYSFGYLRTISGGLVPEDCLICPKMLDCRNKN